MQRFASSCTAQMKNVRIEESFVIISTILSEKLLYNSNFIVVANVWRIYSAIDIWLLLKIEIFIVDIDSPFLWKEVLKCGMFVEMFLLFMSRDCSTSYLSFLFVSCVLCRNFKNQNITKTAKTFDIYKEWFQVFK